MRKGLAVPKRRFYREHVRLGVIESRRECRYEALRREYRYEKRERGRERQGMCVLSSKNYSRSLGLGRTKNKYVLGFASLTEQADLSRASDSLRFRHNGERSLVRLYSCFRDEERGKPPPRRVFSPPSASLSFLSDQQLLSVPQKFTKLEISRDEKRQCGD